MNVRVNDAGENCQIMRIDFRFRRTCQVLRDGDNLAFADSDVLLATTHEQIEITHALRVREGVPHTRSLLMPPSG